MPTPPLALLPALPSELLIYILAYPASPSTLIICQPRASFLQALVQCLPDASPNNRDPTPRHPLLVPTLHQVSTSRNINLVFIQSVSHLRAYLSVFSPPKAVVDSLLLEHKPLLVIYGLIELHRDTSEWSAQGLANTLAGVVEAGHRSKRGLVVFEQRIVAEEPDYYHGDEEVTEEQVREAKMRELMKGWDDELPILNGGGRKGRLGVSEGGWSGRTVEVGRILGRWFIFGKGDWIDI